MVTATSAPYPIITKDMIRKFEKVRNWFDIALPRDIEDMKIDNINIYSVDDLQCIVDENLKLRTSQAKEAYGIVGSMTIEFFSWLQTLNIEPVIKQLYLNTDDIIEKKLQAAIKKGYIKGEDRDNIKKLSQSVINELLHKPTKNLKRLSSSEKGDIVLETVQNLFELDIESL